MALRFIKEIKGNIVKLVYSQCTVTPTSSVSSESQTAQIASLSSAGVGTGVSLLFSSFNLTTIFVIWTIFSQYRTLIFLILTDAYLPSSVVEYITGMKLFSFNFSFLQISNWPGINLGINFLNYNQIITQLETIGIESGSSFVNNINIVLILLSIVLVHIL